MGLREIILCTLLCIVLTYLIAVKRFTAFLYLNQEEAASSFKGTDIPDWIFDLLLGAIGLSVRDWYCRYLNAHGQSVWTPSWIANLRSRLYPLFVNHPYAVAVHQPIGPKAEQLTHRINKLERRWSQ